MGEGVTLPYKIIPLTGQFLVIVKGFHVQRCLHVKCSIIILIKYLKSGFSFDEIVYHHYHLIISEPMFCEEILII